jgi:hypothetical protein
LLTSLSPSPTTYPAWIISPTEVSPPGSFSTSLRCPANSISASSLPMRPSPPMARSSSVTPLKRMTPLK